jgi:hypothetical protein
VLQKRGSNGGRPASSCLHVSVAIPDRVPGSNMPDDPNVSKTAKRYGAPRDPKRLRAELFEQAGRSPQKSRDAWEGIVLAEVGPAPDDARTRAGGRNSSSGSEVLEARGRRRCTEDDDHKEAGSLDLLALDELPTQPRRKASMAPVDREAST